VNPATRSFYTRYYLLTAIAPAYVMALIFYGSAWLFSPASPLPRLLGGTVFYVGGVLVFIGISRLLGALGFWLSGVPHSQTEPSATDRVKLHAVLGDTPAAAGQHGAAEPPPARGGHEVALQPALVELGEVPLLSVGGFTPNQLWISTHTLRTTDERTLGYLVAHERGHLATGPRTCGCAWYDVLWLVAYPLAVLLSPLPLLIAAAALLHALLWLRLAHWMRLRSEARADRWAAECTDPQGYARALVLFHRQVSGTGGAPNARRRLLNMGLSPDEAGRLLESEPGG
jgi:hypothetical protein